VARHQGAWLYRQERQGARYRTDYRRGVGGDEWIVIDTQTGGPVGEAHSSPGAAERDAHSRNQAWEAEAGYTCTLCQDTRLGWLRGGSQEVKSCPRCADGKAVG
jgi:hypothetical protein